MNLILIRHGETDWNRIGRCQGVADIVLNENGKRQARELAESLKNHDISAVYSSNLKERTKLPGRLPNIITFQYGWTRTFRK